MASPSVTSTPTPAPAGVWSTDDFSIAAYLHSRGMALRSASLLPGSRQEYDFVFYDPQRQCDAFAIAYVNSHVYQFDQAQRALKKLVFGWRSDGGGQETGCATDDFSLAAYLVFECVELVGFRRIHRSRRDYRFFFNDIGGDRWSELATNFVNSDAHRFDQSQRALKRIVFGAR